MTIAMDNNHEFIKVKFIHYGTIRENYKCVKCGVGRVYYYIDRYNNMFLTCEEYIIKNIIE